MELYLSACPSFSLVPRVIKDAFIHIHTAMLSPAQEFKEDERTYIYGS